MSVARTCPPPGCASTHERKAPTVSVKVYMPKCPVKPLRSQRAIESINLPPSAALLSSSAPSAERQRAVERGSKTGGLGHLAATSARRASAWPLGGDRRPWPLGAAVFVAALVPPEAPQTLGISSRRLCYSALQEELTGMNPPAPSSLPHHHHDHVGFPPPPSPLTGAHHSCQHRQ